MKEQDQERQDDAQSVRPPIDGDENLPDGAIHRTPEKDPRQGAQRRTEEPDRENKETPN